MPAVQVTCPVLLRCSLWLDIDDLLDLTALDGVHGRDGDLIVVRLPDPKATLATARGLLAKYRARLRFFIASRDGVAAIPASDWAWLTAHCDGDVIDAQGGACAVSHYGPPRRTAVPRELADEQLPEGTGLLLWVSAEEETLRWVTQDRLTIGRIAENDLVIPYAPMSRRHVIIEREGERWTARDYESAGGFGVNGQSCRGQRHELRAGTVLQFALPYRIVVLAVR